MTLPQGDFKAQGVKWILAQPRVEAIEFEQAKNRLVAGVLTTSHIYQKRGTSLSSSNDEYLDRSFTINQR